ncbi:MAG: type II toxin-antitoxin system HicA family toxin [candidate division NC10 bacterium]|nr:type II toxin-antitoxin system HicA family toxin [candidate division NC10 bacterium]MDE2323038.1 type II toxin-antitoxin system HicA family toxin [candidate division NC10 bacterium]
MGCIEILRHQEGSHRKWRNSATGRGTTVPDWGGKDLKLGTVRAIVHQLGLDWSEFQRI